MSKGNPTVRARVSPELLRKIETAIADRNERTRREPWTLSGFVVAAIKEKLAHMERARSRKGKE